MKGLFVTAVAAIAAGVNGVPMPHLAENLRKTFENSKVIQIHEDHMSAEAIELLQAHDADHHGTRDDMYHFEVSGEAARKLGEINVNFVDNTENYLKEMEETFNTDLFCMEEDCHKRDLQDFFGQYQTVEAIHARAEDVVSRYSNARIYTIGQSFEGRDIKMVEIGSGNKPLAFTFCNVHAREWLPAMYCVYMVETLLETNDSMLEDFDMAIMLTANPDGYRYSYETDSNWRKTRKTFPGQGCVGVDINRNYDSNFCGAGASSSCGQITYCGPSPFSEIETQHIRDFTLANRDRIFYVQDVHSYSSLWLTPYGRTRSDPADISAMNSCARAAVEALQDTSGGSLWRYGPAAQVLYVASGVSCDWMYDGVGITHAYVSELRTRSFQPPASNIMPSNREIFAATKANINCAAVDEGLIDGTTPPPSPTPAPCTGWFC